MPVYDTTVQSVTSRVVNKKAGGTTTIYEVLDSEGNKWATFKNTIANEANRLVGQAVQIQGRIEQNGSYQNYTIDDIRMGTFSANQAVQAAQHAQVAQPPQVAQRQQTEIHPNSQTDKDWQIARAVAVKASAQISHDPKVFWENLDALVAYLVLGLKPPEYEGASNTLRSDPHEREPNQFVPEAAYAENPGWESNDDPDRIPF